MKPTIAQMQADLRSLIEQQYRVEALVKLLIHSTQAKSSPPESTSTIEPVADTDATE